MNTYLSKQIEGLVNILRRFEPNSWELLFYHSV
jgi:hypothetical protein